MQMSQFLPIFLCSVNLVFYTLFCCSSLPLSVQQVCSASTRSLILLFFNFFCHSALLFLFLSFCSAYVLSVILLCFYSFSLSALHFISHFTYAQSPPMHPLIFLFLQFHSFLIQNNQPHTVCLIFFYTHLHDGSTSQLLRQKDDNCLSN